MTTNTRLARLERMARERGEPECGYQLDRVAVFVRHGEPQATDPRTCPQCGELHLPVIVEYVVKDRADLARLELVDGNWRLKDSTRAGED